tara:strand:- start:1899 stop:3362 length:1464 start_codon:yes stop_codon:yes gene_type:complete
MKNRKKINIVWFKRDLRTQDHYPLNYAEKEENDYLCIYIYDPKKIAHKSCSLRHLQFVYHSINDINNTLNKFSRKIVIFHNDTLKVFDYLCKEYSISKIFSYQETDVKSFWDIDKKVNLLCLKNNIRWIEYQRDGIVRGLKTRRNWDKMWYTHVSVPVLINKYSKATQKLRKNPFELEINLHNKLTKWPKLYQPAGEKYAHTYLRSFINKRGKHYSKYISKPHESRVSCTRLSTYLAWGNLSVKQAYMTIKYNKNYSLFKRSFNASLIRLKWRCHFIQKFEMECEYEDTCVNRGYENLQYTDNNELINSWKNGTTAIPIVDACIRCLQKTGWINFRMRAMLVSIFCHHFDCNWKKGVYHLAQLFLDYEPGIHYTQFQMQAGVTGINSIRIYNPIKQSKEHDPSGIFIKKWVNELVNVPSEFIHEPWMMTELDKSFYGIKEHFKNPEIDIINSAKLSRKKLWGHRSNDLVKKENLRLIKKHTRNSKSI